MIDTIYKAIYSFKSVKQIVISKLSAVKIS